MNSHNFFRCYQVISAIPKHLLTKARNEALIKKELYFNNTFNFQFDESTQIDLIKIRTSDFYKVFNTKTHSRTQGPPKMGYRNYFLTKKMCGKNISPPSKPYVKSPSSKNFKLNLCTALLLPKENFFVMVSSQMMTVNYIVAKRTPLTIL